MQFDPPRLMGSRCAECDALSFPPRETCPSCFAQGHHKAVPLATEGTIYSYTVVHQAPPGRETPYTLAYVDLDDGVRLLAQVRGASDGELIGQRVTLVFEAMPEREGASIVGYAFRLHETPAGEAT